MAVVVTSRTSLLVTAITVGLVFIPAIVGQAQCNNITRMAWDSRSNYFTSPGYPRNYPSNMSCQWSIRAVDSSNVVLLKLIDFDLEGPAFFVPDCTNDYVEIYDGSYRIQLLCGQVYNKQFTSSGSDMTVVFHSDRSNNFRGFNFTYSSQNKSAQCGNTSLLASDPWGKFLNSPNYPNNYSRNTDCEWHIRTYSSSTVIVLVMVTFLLEDNCQKDYVKIHDGNSSDSPIIKLLCGPVRNTQFRSTGTSVTVVFHSDGSNNFRGFSFKFIAEKKPNIALCGNNTLVASRTAKYLTSPDYPNNYPSNVDCQWHITADFYLHVVVLKSLDFFLEWLPPSCINDYVAIYDGDSSDSPRIQLFCVQTSNTVIRSTGRYMTVVFHSNGYNNYKGFKFEYTSLDKSALCKNSTQVATGAAKYITSPGYSYNYLSNMNCHWNITADLSSHVVLLKLLDFYLNGRSSSCRNDYVAIYDGDSTSSPRIQLLCGQVSNRQFTSTGPSMTVVFRSDGSDNYHYKRFKFEYTSLNKSDLCTDTTLVATGTAKYITSPGYPKNYISKVNCHWLITADLPSHIVVLKVLGLYLDGPTCTFDNVTLYDGNSLDSPKIQFLCGQASNTQQFTSSGPSMTVVFHYNVNTSVTGLKFEYTSLKKSDLCSDVTLLAKETANYLTSPNYPNPYPRNMDCEWHITAGSYSSVVVLWYSELSLDGYQSECTSDYVKIYDGPSTSSPLLKVMCSQMYYGKFASTDSNMTVVFHSDGINNYYNTGFRFAYHSQEKGQENAGPGNTGTIIVALVSCFGVIIIIVVFAICIRRRLARGQLRHTENIVLHPTEAAGSANSLLIVSLWTSNTRETPPNEEMEDSQNSADPPPYSSLNFNVDDNVPAYTSRSPGYNINEPPPPYSPDLPGGIAE